LLGFAGNPDSFISTAEIRRRLGYASAKTWYNDAAKRRASHFPNPIRRGLYRLGDLQAWSAAGGFSQARPELAQSSLNARPAASQAAGGPKGEGASAPRPEIAGRLRLLIDNR
jgi:hypothetical protein